MKRARNQRGAREAGWAHLPADLLRLIVDRLSPPDLVRLRSACTSWRSAAAANLPHTFTFEPPQLMLLDGEHELSFYSVFRAKFLDLKLSKAFRHARCCGYLDGWLIMVADSDFEISVLNPITHARVMLPSGSRFPFRPPSIIEPEICAVSYVKKVAMSNPPTSQACVVAAIGRACTIALCKPGGADWSLTVFEGLRGRFDDIVFQNGLLYALDFEGGLAVFSLNSRLRLTIISVIRMPENVVYPILGRASRYLVESCGELLIVIKQYNAPAMSFCVLKLCDWGWDQVKSLGDCALFVGSIRSESVCVKDFEHSGLRENCIYFTRQLIEWSIPHAIGVYSMGDGMIKAIPLGGRHSLMFEPVWIKPTICGRGINNIQ